VIGPGRTASTEPYLSDEIAAVSTGEHSHSGIAIQSVCDRRVKVVCGGSLKEQLSALSTAASLLSGTGVAASNYELWRSPKSGTAGMRCVQTSPGATMNDNQQGQGSNASSGSQSGASQQSQSGRQGQQGGQQATPGGSNPSGGGQPGSQQNQSGNAEQRGGATQGGSQQSQSGRGDQQGAGLDEEDITQSPRRDVSSQQGSDNSNGGNGQQPR
jgi:hypothetical protein